MTCHFRLVLSLFVVWAAIDWRSRPQLCQAADKADVVLLSGHIATLDDDERFVQALAIRDGRILRSGSSDEIQKLVGPKTTTIRLQGRTVIPGLIESHCHAIGVGINALNVPYADLRSIQALQRWVRNRAKDLPAGRWIHVPRTDITRIDEMRYPSRDELDQASATHPVVMTASRKHVLNSVAWETIGVKQDTDEVAGAKIVRDEQGRPWLLSGGSQLLNDATPKPEHSDEEKLSALRRVHQVYSSVGITSIFERALNADGWKMYDTLRKRGELDLRVTGTIRQQFRSGDHVRDFTKKLGLKTGDGDDRLRVGPLKITVDGGIHWGTARLSEPFGSRRINFYKIGTLVDPDYRGDIRYSVDQMRDIFHAGHELGWQMCVHVAGDAGVDRVLDALDQVNQKLPIEDRRFTLTHAYFPSPDIIKRCRALGVCVDTQTYVFYRDARFIHRIYGRDWSERFIGVGGWYRHGVPVAVNSDHMIGLDPDRAMNSFNPFLQLYVTVTRRDVYGNQYGESHRLNRSEALRCMTSNAAYLSFDEAKKGTLEPGKLADLVVLDRDYFTCPEEEIRAIRPVMTMVAGQVTYRRNSEADSR